jgi:LuxR family transcriptional regulator, maltose regulon positive regulatory protein
MAGKATPATEVSRRRIIKRPRLTRMLDESGARIILLVAPAGYGKTTLAHEWLEGRRAAWYRASPASADVAALAAGLARAAAEIVPGAGARMTQRLRATDRPEEDVRILAEMLAEDLAEWPDAWLAIDDYQFAMDSPASEEFLGLLSELPQIRMLLTSRRRPAWATARRRVYGELEEVDRTMLAMTDEEALLLLGSKEAATPEFLTSTQGWPALIGLAAVATSKPLSGYPSTSSPDEYLAEELYEAASTELRSRLCDLALAPTDRLVEYLFSGASARNLLDEGLRLGFLSQHASSFELHPVVRDFLVGRARKRTEHGERVKSIGDALLRARAWDEAFALAQQHDSKELILQVVEHATAPLLAEGRVSTLEVWLNYAGDKRIANEVLDYAEAEVAFRNASHTKAEVLGARAAAGLGPSHRLASRAYARAGHSAYLRGNLDRASSLLSEALESALTKRDVRQALWGQFLCAVEAERPDSRALLEQFADAVDRHPGDLMRIKTGEIFLALRGLCEVSTDLLSTIHLADHVNDYMSESSFLNGWMGLAIYFGRYSEVLEISSRQRALIENFRLDFVLPHLYLREAAAYRGQRRFRECRRALDKAEASGIEPRDADVMASVRMARALAELHQGRPAIALELVEHPPPGHHSPSWTGEYLATRALVLAVAGQEDAALQEADSADSATLAIEARGLSAFARAVADCRRANSREKHSVCQAYERAAATNNVDSLVSAYRSYPPLLGKIWRYCDQKMFLLEAVDRADDGSLARSAKLPGVITRGGTGSLSPREQEILDLVRQGLTNPEIAQTLFVSVSTVKVHMRHIFEKLGVRTRTEAALLADS